MVIEAHSINRYVHCPWTQHTRTSRARKPNASSNSMRRVSQAGAKMAAGGSIVGDSMGGDSMVVTFPVRGSIIWPNAAGAASMARAVAAGSLVMRALQCAGGQRHVKPEGSGRCCAAQ